MPRHVAALLMLVFHAVLVRTAWNSDDTLMSLRTVLNVTHGNGLTFNVGERVQTFTHPLWLALLTASHLVIRNVLSRRSMRAGGRRPREPWREPWR